MAALGAPPAPSALLVPTAGQPALEKPAPPPSSGVTGGAVRQQIPPVYPSAALRLHLSGTVVLTVTVSPTGKVTQVKTVSGNPLLAAAATAAVKNWRYEPFLLNGRPVQMDTTVRVEFVGR